MAYTDLDPDSDTYRDLCQPEGPLSVYRSLADILRGPEPTEVCAGCGEDTPTAEMRGELCPPCGRMSPEEWAHEAAIIRAESMRDER